MIQLQTEGITTVGDLADFEKDSLQQLADNLHCPGGRIPDTSTNAATGTTIPTPTFTFGAKSQQRLLVAFDLIQYYNTMGQDLTAANMQWTHLMKNFKIQWMVLKDRKMVDDPEVPKITKALPIIMWMEAFQDFLHWIIGVRMIPLACLICANVNVPSPPPQLTETKHTLMNMALWRLSLSLTHLTLMHCTVMITHQSTFTSRKPPEEQLMLPQSNHISGIMMEEAHGWH